MQIILKIFFHEEVKQIIIDGYFEKISKVSQMDLS